MAVGVRTPVSASSSHALPGFDFLTVSAAGGEPIRDAGIRHWE